jgi:cytidylate kinase
MRNSVQHAHENHIDSAKSVMLESLHRQSKGQGEFKMSLITITGGIGCEEMTIARLVADALELELYDDQRLQEKAIEMGLSSEGVKSLDEKAPGLFNRLLRRKPEIYLDLLEALVYKVARQGEGIIFGHGAQFLLRAFEGALHVRIFSSKASRV